MSGLFVSVNAALERRGQVLLIRRAGTSFYPGFFGLVAGHMEHGEDPKGAILREMEEEVGYRGADLSMPTLAFQTTRIYPKYTYLDLYFRLRLCAAKSPRLERGKVDSFVWASPRSLPPNVIPFVAEVVQALRGSAGSVRGYTYWFDHVHGPHRVREFTHYSGVRSRYAHAAARWARARGHAPPGPNQFYD